MHVSIEKKLKDNHYKLLGYLFERKCNGKIDISWGQIDDAKIIKHSSITSTINSLDKSGLITRLKGGKREEKTIVNLMDKGEKTYLKHIFNNADLGVLIKFLFHNCLLPKEEIIRSLLGKINPVTFEFLIEKAVKETLIYKIHGPDVYTLTYLGRQAYIKHHFEGTLKDCPALNDDNAKRDDTDLQKTLEWQNKRKNRIDDFI